MAGAQNFTKLLNNPAFNQSPKLAYGTTKDFYPVSPNALGSGISAQIPTTAFSGVATIILPLYTAKYKDILVPIELNYHTSLVKPDLLPGVTGLGWALQAGGSISRIINGAVDIGPKPSTIFKEGDFSLSDPNWNSQEVINSMKGDKNYYFSSQDPDTYVFNINGNVGKFCVSHTGEFQIISDDGIFFFVTLNKTLKSGIEYLDGFTIKDTNGNTYEFGGENATETTQPGFNNSTYDNSLIKDSYVLPMTWHLKKITSRHGYLITFNYESVTTVFKSRFIDYTIMNGESVAHSSKYLDNERAYVIKEQLLKDIVFMNNKIVFEYSSSSQLSYPPSSLSNYDNFIWDKNPASNSPISIPKIRKLDKVTIYEHLNKLYHYEFIYTSNNSTRLKLLSVKKKTIDNELTSDSYIFEYNIESLPSYLSGKTDHYGFYNDKGLFTNDIVQKINTCIDTFDKSSGQQNINALKSTIDAAKQPNVNTAIAEVLKKITNHNGGYTVFTYEPHQYSKKHSIWPNVVVQNSSGNLRTSGIRIKEITKYDKSNIVLDKTIYHYVSNYIEKGNKSSGVLAYTPEYIDYFYRKNIFIGKTLSAQDKSVLFINSNPVYPLSNLHGSHITYSEVTIEKPGNNFSVLTFKNYDNGYLDSAPLAHGATLVSSSSTYTNSDEAVAFWKQDEGVSMELERGQVLSDRLFDVNRNLYKQTIYEYNDDKEKGVRYYRLEPTCVNNMKLWSYRISAGLHYTYFPYLSKKVETIYPEALTNSIEYTYDDNYRLLKTEKSFDSKDNSYLKTYIYPIDKMSDPVAQKMVDLNMIGYNIEVNTRRNSTLLEKSVSTYEIASPTTIQLKTISKQIGNGPLKIQTTYSKYDDFGNPVEEKRINGLYRCVIWSEFGDNITATIENASYNDLQSALGFVPVNGTDVVHIDNLRSSPLMKDAMITTFTYYPHGLIKSKTDPRGNVTTYTYDSFLRPQGEFDNRGNIIKYMEYKNN